jgi:hypothetical protein
MSALDNALRALARAAPLAVRAEIDARVPRLLADPWLVGATLGFELASPAEIEAMPVDRLLFLCADHIRALEQCAAADARDGGCRYDGARMAALEQAREVLWRVQNFGGWAEARRNCGARR